MQKDIVMKTGVVQVHETSSGQKFVCGSELYKGLGITVPYAEWIHSRLKECKAVEDEDFSSFIKRNDLENGCPKSEFIIKLDVAREIIKKENVEKGGDKE